MSARSCKSPSKPSTPIQYPPHLGTLPIGIGFLHFVLKLEDVPPMVKEYKPAVVWLFVPKSLNGYAS
jgi:hypothetical protein